MINFEINYDYCLTPEQAKELVCRENLKNNNKYTAHKSISDFRSYCRRMGSAMEKEMSVGEIISSYEKTHGDFIFIIDEYENGSVISDCYFIDNPKKTDDSSLFEYQYLFNEEDKYFARCILPLFPTGLEYSSSSTFYSDCFFCDPEKIETALFIRENKKYVGNLFNYDELQKNWNYFMGFPFRAMRAYKIKEVHHIENANNDYLIFSKKNNYFLDCGHVEMNIWHIGFLCYYMVYDHDTEDQSSLTDGSVVAFCNNKKNLINLIKNNPSIFEEDKKTALEFLNSDIEPNFSKKSGE